MEAKDFCQLPNTIYMKIFLDTKWELDFQSEVCLYHFLPASDILRDQTDTCQAWTEQLAGDRLRVTW